MNGDEKLVFTDDMINIEGLKPESYIMHSAEDPVMKELARLACQNGGDILEMGFGMGISATYIQSHDIRSHTIIEIHPEVYKRALKWASDKKNVNIILGDWYDIVPVLDKKFNGILHDTYGDVRLKYFFDVVKPICAEGAILTLFQFHWSKPIPLNVSKVYLTKEQRANLPTHISQFELMWNRYINGEFVK